MKLMRHHTVILVLLSLILLFRSTISFSQPGSTNDARVQTMLKHKKDSLVKLIRHRADDTTKVNQYYELYGILLGIRDVDSAIQVATTSYSLALKLKEPRALVTSLLAMGGVYGNFGSRDYEKSLHYFLEGAKITEENNLYKLCHTMYSSILNLYFYTGDFPNAMKLATKGLLLAEKNRDEKRIALYYNLFGFIYLRQGDFAEAEKNYMHYLNLANTLPDSILIADAANCLGDVFFLEKNYTRAFDYHFKAWAIYNRHYHEPIKFKPDQMAYTAYKISCVYKMISNYAEALRYADDGFAFTRKHGTNEYDLVLYQLNASEIYLHIGNYNRALALLYEALALSKKIKHNENIRDSYQLLAEIYKQRNKYDSAYHYQALYAILKDSIVNENSQREIQRIHAQYNLQKKDQAIAIQQAQLESQHLQRDALIITFIFLLVIMFLLYNRYRLKQKNKFQAELTYQQNELFNTIVTFQDTERKRIAQDIHDSVGSVLSAAKLQLSALDETKHSFSQDHLEKYNSALQLIDQASIELRNISHNIMPAALARVGLIAALENLIDKISTYSGVHINFNVYGFKERLAEKTEIGIYPVVLELINNVLKHAQASQATVQLVRHPQYINITVEDNGKGFNVKTKKVRGIGLKNVMSRIQYLKGTINIDSSEGQGTSIMIDIPY